MNIQQLFKRKAQPSVIPQLKRAEHMSKGEFIALLTNDALIALNIYNDKRTYNMLLDEIMAIEAMSRAEFAFYCWQRASNAAYSYTPADNGNVQLSLF